jgi:phage baseplate assembly protein W
MTYGIDFPFKDSFKGDSLNLTESSNSEVRANLIHLLLTRKGSRYFMPDFGTRIYDYIFEQNDLITYNLIEEEIREGVKKYIPNLEINKISITNAENEIESVEEQNNNKLFKQSSTSYKPYTAKVKLDFTINNGTFSSSDFIIINI